jgi:uncharacterized peroxidase-related enzyme
MPRIIIPGRDEAPAGSRQILDAVHKDLGIVPSLFRLIALSPHTLAGFHGFSSELAKTLDARTHAQIAIAVAKVNGCDHCLAASSYIALNVAKIGPLEIARNREGASGDPKADSTLRFAVKVAQQRGQVEDADLAAVRAAGFSDPEIVEIVGIVAENMFTNLISNVARLEIDFPLIPEAAGAQKPNARRPPAGRRKR